MKHSGYNRLYRRLTWRWATFIIGPMATTNVRFKNSLSQKPVYPMIRTFFLSSGQLSDVRVSGRSQRLTSIRPCHLVLNRASSGQIWRSITSRFVIFPRQQVLLIAEPRLTRTFSRSEEHTSELQSLT